MLPLMQTALEQQLRSNSKGMDSQLPGVLLYFMPCRFGHNFFPEPIGEERRDDSSLTKVTTSYCTRRQLLNANHPLDEHVLRAQEIGGVSSHR
jgi:hypothetical protein